MNIKDTYINYVQYGNDGGKDIVLLHGWGQNIEMMDPLGRQLQDNFKITIIDFPGFGKSPEPPYVYSIYDYYNLLDEFLKKLKIKDPILVGHSFGGRVAIVYAANKSVSKLVLLGSPYRRSNTKANFKIKVLKTMKKIPVINLMADYAKKHMGSVDYRSASPVMRQVLVKTINENLGELLPKIKASTILIWGSEDTEVPIEEAKYIESMIKDSGLIVYEGCSHYAYLERLDQTVNIINEFLKDVK